MSGACKTPGIPQVPGNLLGRDQRVQKQHQNPWLGAEGEQRRVAASLLRREALPGLSLSYINPPVKLEEDFCPVWWVPGPLLSACVRVSGNLFEPVCIPASYDGQGGHFSTT